MYKIVQKLALLGIILSNIFLSHQLEAIQIRIEFYPQGQVPEKYQHLCKGALSDCTLVFMEDCPLDKTFVVEERNPLKLRDSPKLKLKGSFNNPSAMFCVDAPGYIPGWPIELTITDANKENVKSVTFVPQRLCVISPVDNARIEATLYMPSPAYYKIEFNGFQKTENIKIKSCSYSETHELQFTASSPFSYSPDVINKRGGIANLTFTRPSGEVLKLEFPWGWEWMKYMLIYDKKGNMKLEIETDEFKQKMPEVAQYFRSKR